MDALNLLTEQHDELDDLIEDVESSDDPAEKALLFAAMADKLAAHAAMEERIFYPAVIAKKTEELLLESAEEHLSIKRVLSDMLALRVDDKQFDAKLSVLKEQLEHHAHVEEEKELFPIVRRMMSGPELDGLGSEMSALYEELLLGEPRNAISGQTAEAAPVKP